MDTINCLTQVAHYLSLAPMTLMAAFELDKHGAAADWRPDGKQWPGMSIKHDEAKILYAVIRALRPADVIEFGAYGGCSATHILQALSDNGFGNLVSVDIDPLRPPGVPSELTHRWKFIQANGITHKFGDYRCDICFEDTSHTRHSTSNLCRKGLRLGAQLAIVHDVTNPTSGSEVRAGIEDVFDDYLVIEPGHSLGLAFCLRRNAKKDFESVPDEAGPARVMVGETEMPTKEWRA